uniref:Uncharacterized protein n=1 Tax=Arcella intermedia TaxID=1963864 RepID=A0A6B2LEH2_9EUKA
MSGKLCLITGASSGIGKATVKVFVNYGAKVCATGRNKESLNELKKLYPICVVDGDLTEKGVPKRIVDEAVKQLGGLTTLVNCAGAVRGGAFGTDACNLENFEYNFNSNTKSVFEMMVHAIPHLKEAKGRNPSIVNVSSVNGLVSFATVPNYCASKAAVDMLTQCAAIDLAPMGIRVNAVNPGVVVTELQKRGGVGEEAYQAFLKRSIEVTHPLAQSLGRLATPEEVGELIAFLASDKAAFISGDSVKIDGARGVTGLR